MSHDPTLAHLWHRLAALPVTTPTRPHFASVIPRPASVIRHLPSVIRHLPSVIRHLPSVIRHLPSVIRHLPSVIRHLGFAIRLFCFPIPRSEFLLPHFSKGFQRSHQLSVPGRLVAAVPLECRAAIQRRAVVPLVGLVGLDLLMLGQQLLEPADVPLDDRADEDQRRVLIAGRRGDLAIVHKLAAADIAQRQPISAVVPELVADAVAQRIEGMEEGIEFRVEVRLDTALTQQPDEADDFRIIPGGFAVHNVQQFGPASEQPAATFGAFFEPAHDHRRVVIRGRIRVTRPYRGLKKQLAAEVVNPAELFRADRVHARPRIHSDPVGQVGRRDSLSAIDLPRQPHRAANQIMLEGIAGLHGRDRLLGPVFQFLGVFLGQDGHDGPGGHAVCDGCAFAGLSPLGFGPGALLGITAVGFDLCCGGHGVSSPGGIDQRERTGGIEPQRSLRARREISR